MNRDPGHGPGSPERLLPWKLAIFGLGAAFGIGGMAIDSRTLVWIGCGVLFAGVFLRFLLRPERDRSSHSEAQDEPASMEDDSSSNAGPPIS